MKYVPITNFLYPEDLFIKEAYTRIKKDYPDVVIIERKTTNEGTFQRVSVTESYYRYCLDYVERKCNIRDPKKDILTKEKYKKHMKKIDKKYKHEHY